MSLRDVAFGLLREYVGDNAAGRRLTRLAAAVYVAVSAVGALIPGWYLNQHGGRVTTSLATAAIVATGLLLRVRLFRWFLLLTLPPAATFLIALSRSALGARAPGAVYLGVGLALVWVLLLSPAVGRYFRSARQQQSDWDWGDASIPTDGDACLPADHAKPPMLRPALHDLAAGIWRRARHYS